MAGSESGSEASWPDPGAFVNHAFAEAKGYPSPFDSRYSVNSGAHTPRSAKIRLHKSGSVSVMSDDMTTTITPRHGGVQSLQVMGNGMNSHEVYENFDSTNFSIADSNSQGGLASNWKSAVAVSSLHRAYSRVVNENRSLKAALAASESRCADLLQLSGSTEQKDSEQTVAFQVELKELRHQLARREEELAKLQDELAQVQSEKLALINWKSERLASERQDLDSLRVALEETNNEKAEMADKMSGLREVLGTQRTALSRAKASGSRAVCGVVRRWQRKQLRRGWRAWEVCNRDAALEEARKLAEKERAKRQEQNVQRAVGRLRHRRLAMAFAAFRAGASHARAQRQRLEGIVCRIKNREKSKALRSWVEHVRGRKLLRRIVVRMAAQAVAKELFIGFSTWDRWTKYERRSEHDARVRELEAGIAKTSEDLAEASGAHAAGVAELQRANRERLRTLAAKTASKWSGQLQAFAFYSLKDTVARLVHRRKRVHFERWRANARELLRHRRLLARHVGRMRHRLAGAVFQQWLDFATETREYRVKVGRFVARMRHAGLYRTFFLWKENAQESAALRRKARRIFARISANSTARCFFSWRDLARALKEERATEDAERAREHALLAKFSARWRNRTAMQAFEAWHDGVEERKRVRTTMSRTLRRLSHQSVFSALRQWVDATSEAQKRESDEYVADLERRNEDLEFRLRQTEAACDKLRGELSSEKTQRELDAEASLEAQSKRIILLWKSRKVAGAFVRWREQARRLRHDRQLLASFTAKWKSRELFSSLGKWKEVVAERKFLRRFLTGAFGDFDTRQLAMGFRTWAAYSRACATTDLEEARSRERAHAKDLEVRLAALEEDHRAATQRFESDIERLWAQRDRIVGRLSRKLQSHSRTHLLSVVFRCFRQVTQRKARERRLMAKFAARMRNRTAASAFFTWSENAAARRHDRLVLQKVTARMRMLKVSAAYGGWRDAVRERVANRAKVNLFFGRKEKLTFYRCFKNWKMYAEESQDKKERAKRIFAALTQESLQMRFSQWRTHVLERKAERESFDQSEALLRRSVARIAHGSLARCFAAWSNAALESRLARERVKHLVLKWKSRAVARAFDAWADNAAERQRQRQVMRQVLYRLDRRQVSAAFRKWSEFVRRSVEHMLDDAVAEVYQLKLRVSQLESDNRAAEAAFGADFTRLIEQRRVVREKLGDAVMEKWRSAYALRAFTTWREAAKHRKACRVRVTRFVQRSRNAFLARAFDGWLARALELRRKRALVRRSVRKFEGNLAAKALESWKSAVATAKERARALRLLGKFWAHMGRAPLARAWRAWTVQVFSSREKQLQADLAGANRRYQRAQVTAAQLREMCLRKAVASWTRPCVVRSFVAWHANATAMRVQRQRMQLLVQRWLQIRTTRAFRSWRFVVVKERERRTALRALVRRWTHQKIGRGFRTWMQNVHMQLLVDLRQAGNENLVLAHLGKSRVATLSRLFRRWWSACRSGGRRDRALRTMNLYARRLRHSALMPAFNQWKLSSLAIASDALRFVDRQGVVERLRKGILQVFSSAVVFSSNPSIAAGVSGGESRAPPLFFDSGIEDRAGTAETSMFRLSTGAGLHGPGLQQQSLAATQWMAEPQDWGVLGESLQSACAGLFGTDCLRVFEVCKSKITQYDVNGGAMLMFESSDPGITPAAVKLGQVVAVHQASLDPRYSAAIDTPSSAAIDPRRASRASVSHLAASQIDFQDPGRAATVELASAGTKASIRAMTTPQSGHPSRVLAFICVPIFDPENRVAGLLQATKWFKDADSYDYQYLEMCNVALTVVADAVANMFGWKRANEAMALDIERKQVDLDSLQKDVGKLRQSKEEYEDYVTEIRQKYKRTDEHVSKELKQAYARIRELESETIGAVKLEAQVKRMIAKYDSAVGNSNAAVGGGGSKYHASTASFLEELDLPGAAWDGASDSGDELRDAHRLERDQHLLSLKLGSARADLF